MNNIETTKQAQCAKFDGIGCNKCPCCEVTRDWDMICKYDKIVAELSKATKM